MPPLVTNIVPAKILINAPSHHGSRQTGVIRVCFSLLEALIARGHYDYALRTAYKREELPAFLQAAALEIVTVPPARRHLVDIFRQSITVPALARRIGAAAVLSIDHVCPAFGGPPKAMIVHDVFFRVIPDQYDFGARLRADLIYKIIARTSDMIVANSATTARDLEQFYPAARDKTVVVLLDTTLSSTAGMQGPLPDIEAPYILTVANGTSNKNLATIGRAARLLDERGLALRIVHVGSDPADTIRQAVGRPLANVQILRVTDIDDGALVRLYRGAACYVNTSLYEGFCLPIIEAQKLGCPVICSDRSATAEVAGTGAILCDPNNAPAIAVTIERILRDPGFRQTLCDAGTRNAARFSWAKSAEALEAVFAKLVAKHR